MDDSVVVRGFVARWIASVPDLEVVGSARNGRVALDQIEHLRPDIVLLDLDMPEIDGLTVLPLLLARRPGVSVVVMSTLTQRNAEISLRCLAVGAVDYIPKPETQRDATLSNLHRDELIGKLTALARARRVRNTWSAEPRACRFAPSVRPGIRPRILAIGSSTGGPRAVVELLRELSGGAGPMPILIAQHLPALFTKAFASLLATETGIPAREAAAGEPLEAGSIYVAPGGCHLGIGRDRDGHAIVRLDDGEPVEHCRPAADILFRDAAHHFGRAALAVVLTGMGSDGTQGARDIAAAGGCVLAQDEASSTVWGMPGSVARQGLARYVLPPSDLGRRIRAMAAGEAR